MRFFAVRRLEPESPEEALASQPWPEYTRRPSLHVPVAICPATGATAVGSEQTPLPEFSAVPRSHEAWALLRAAQRLARADGARGRLAWPDYLALREALLRACGYGPRRRRLLPGSRLNQPVLDVRGTELPPVWVSANGCQLVVTAAVVQRLLDARLTGVAAWPQRWRSPHLPPRPEPSLYQLETLSECEAPVHELSRRLCPYCDCIHGEQRLDLHYGSPPPLEVSTWDGSDFFRLNPSNGLLLISERARDVLAPLALGRLEFQEWPTVGVRPRRILDV